MKKIYILTLAFSLLIIFSGCTKKTTSETCPITTGGVSCGATSGTVAP